MEASVITKGRYKYVHDVKIGPPEAIDVHHIFIVRSAVDYLPLCSYFSCLMRQYAYYNNCSYDEIPDLAMILMSSLFFMLSTCMSSKFSGKKTASVYDLLNLEKPVAIALWSFVAAGFLVRQILRNEIEKESVIILPAFGVQLETVYRSGNTVHQFVPIDKILKPVLNECVTPVTCYWSLSLIIRGENELLLVFKGLYPPVIMLVPIWKALCAATEVKEWAEMPSDSDT